VFNPKLSCKSNQITCKELPLPQPISICNPADNSIHHLERVSPSTSRRTLGVILTPDGKGDSQIKHCLNKAREFLRKFSNCSMPQEAKWIAITTVIEPAMIYPLLNTSFSPKQIKSIEFYLVST
jgi:hypothetical protein